MELDNREGQKVIEKLQRRKSRKSHYRSLLATIAITISSLTYYVFNSLDNNHPNRPSNTIESAFAGNCDSKPIYLKRYNGQFTAEPNAVATLKFMELRKQYPDRFRNITNDQGRQWIMESYDRNSDTLTIPTRFDCE